MPERPPSLATVRQRAADAAARQAILDAIRAENGLVDAAADRLDVSRRTLYREIAALDLGTAVAQIRADLGVTVRSGFEAR